MDDGGTFFVRRDIISNMRESTLCYFIDQAASKVLLGKKLRGRDAGKFNGYGGKRERDETIVACLNRECQEEAQIVPVNPTERGNILYKFYIPGVDEIQTLKVYVFTCNQMRGEPVVSDEMEPHWFNFTDIPWDQMEANDKLWLMTLLTTHKKIDALLAFDRNSTQLSESYLNWK